MTYSLCFKICRFYTKQSWFLHGRAENGPTELPVIGQEVILTKEPSFAFIKKSDGFEANNFFYCCHPLTPRSET